MENLNPSPRFNGLPFLSYARPLMAVALMSGTVKAVDFETEIRPILEKSCTECHGPDKQKSGFRLDLRASLLKGGDSGVPAIVPGKPEGSPLIAAIKGEDPDTKMPPKGALLGKQQVALIEEWITSGAHWPGQMDAVEKTTAELWSLQPLKRPDVPKQENASTPIDAFLIKELRAKGLGYNKRAEPRDLIRRVSILLTGIAPTLERVTAFEAASRLDSKVAYTALVDELLASPHFGERWTQHWLDVIRWAESNGSEANLYRKNAWIYRDYLIRAFNEDRPYDQFIREQIAGDQMGVGEALGFLVAGPHVPAETVGQEPSAIRQARADRLDEMMQTIGASMLGLTVGCARCHNHKFDPISIKDYYSLTAVFEGIEFGGRYPELGKDHPRVKRAAEIYQSIAKERELIRGGGVGWEEDWGGFKEFYFPSTDTQALRIDFDKGYVAIDELEVFGPDDKTKNLALNSFGTTLVGDPKLQETRGDIKKANDGEFGTQQWKARAPKGSNEKPWVEIRFPHSVSTNRFRFSNNREYYLETDYLLKEDAYQYPGYRISAQQKDGNWKQLESMAAAGNLLKEHPELKAASDQLHKDIATLQEEGPRYSFVGRFTKPNVTHVLRRGSPETPGEEVMPAGFAILNGSLGLDSSASDSSRREAFAKWITRPEHPLTARVMVNRVWHHLFGAGIVTTTTDFGVAGSPPTHPELLDYLAAEFVTPEPAEQKPWSIKSLIKNIVLTEAFQQSSAPREDGLKADASAALLWRFPPKRVDAEVIRDSILQASGTLDPAIGGRSYRIHDVKKPYAQWAVLNNHGPQTWRRMLYQERMRRVDDQMFTAFDFPDCGQVKAKRPVSTTPLQALNLMNSEFVTEQAELLAKRAAQGCAANAYETQVKHCFQLLLNRAPDETELAASLVAVKEAGLPIVCRSLLNSNEFAFLP